MSDDFYIGYLDKSPPALARRTRWIALTLAVMVTGLAVVFAARQMPSEPGTFEFGITKTFEGVLYEYPLPVLRMTTMSGSVTNFLLVGAGKHGLPAFARGHDGQNVRFGGSLIQMGSSVMVELNDEKSFTVLSPAVKRGLHPAEEPLGEITLTGELVDTKCYFGVMRPATGKVHRSCAVRCLSGGVPPGLLVHDQEGDRVVVLLVGKGGRPLDFDVQWAARVVRAEGLLVRRDSLLELQVTQLALSPR